MDDQLTISTPEQVAFHYEVAGIGSRFVAALLDHLIIFLALFLTNCAVLSIGSSAGGLASSGSYWVLAVLAIIFFLIFWGYFTLFELVWNGQTPGKRAGRLRVIRRDGQPVHAGEVIVRNLVRLVDFLPGFYGVGLISMFVDKDARRLGDLAAGTIVIREGQETRLQHVQVPAGAGSQPAMERAAYRQAPGTPYAQPSPGYYRPRYDPLPGVSLRDLMPEDYVLIREMVIRARRGELARGRADELSDRLATGVATRIGHDFGQWRARGWRPLTFLEAILYARDARGE